MLFKRLDEYFCEKITYPEKYDEEEKRIKS
jgi:hypothetical protein